MKSAWACAAVAAALLLVGCTNAVPPVPAPTPTPYLSLLDGNAIHPIEGARAISIHPIPSFSASGTESTEVRVDGYTVRFNRTMSASGSIEANGTCFLLVLETLTDKRSVEPARYAQFLDYLNKTPSAVETTTKVIVSPSGEALSTKVSGGAANTSEGARALQDSSPEDFLMLLVGRGPSLRQGETIDDGDTSKSGVFNIRLTVQGRGVYRNRPVIVLSLDGTDIRQDDPNEPTRTAGFIFLDEAIGISSYAEIDFVGQSTSNGKTARTVSNLTMSADLSGAGPSL